MPTGQRRLRVWSVQPVDICAENPAASRHGGRPPTISGEKLDAILAALDGGMSKAAVCRTFDVKRTTLLETLARGLVRRQRGPAGVRAKSGRLSVLSAAEQEALYGLPDFDGQQVQYLSLSEAELALAASRPGLHAQVYCAQSARSTCRQSSTRSRTSTGSWPRWASRR